MWLKKVGSISTPQTAVLLVTLMMLELIVIPYVIPVSRINAQVQANGSGPVYTDPVYGGTVYFSAGGAGPFTDNFNPYSPSVTPPIDLLYETLMYYNPVTNQWIPQIANNFTWVNATALKVYLNPEAKWSDGKPITAQDVVFTFLTVKKNTAMDFDGVWSVLSNVTPINNYTVLFTFSTPSIPFGYYILNFYPIPVSYTHLTLPTKRIV